MDFSKLLLYIPGVIFFLVGSGRVREWLRIRRAEFGALADVVECTHVVKKDKKERDIYDYYNVVVEYTNPENHHRERQAVKSPTEYAVSQQVRVLREKNSTQVQVIENRDEFIFNPWAMMIGGALLILLALEQNRGNEVRAMAYLAAVLAGAGLCLIWNYVSLKRRNLQPLEGEIVSVYTRQISKGTKILKGDKFTYYPVVRYMLDGRENRRRCAINSGNEKSFKIGESMTLYYDPKDKVVLEKHAHPGVLIAGIALAVLGVLSGLSILSVVIPH